MEKETFNDAELLVLLKEGHDHAFRSIYHSFASGLFRYVRRNISSKEDCEEIIQDVFESLWKRRSEIRIESSLQAYLYSMVRYKTILYFKKSKQRRMYAAHHILFEAAWDSIDLGAMDPHSIQDLVDQRISELPESCRTALTLRLSENLSNQDIARRMNVRKKTVEVYIFRAISLLRESFGTASA